MNKVILLTGAALLALWGTSFGLSFVDLGRGSLPVALAIAVVKALLVLAIFMELAQARTSIRLTIIAATSLAAILVGLVVTDVELRDPPPLVVPGYARP